MPEWKKKKGDKYDQPGLNSNGMFTMTFGDTVSGNFTYDASDVDNVTSPVVWTQDPNTGTIQTGVSPGPFSPTTTPPFSVGLPGEMTEEEAILLLTTCVVCDAEDVPGICPTCKETILEARTAMLKEWMKDFEEFQKAG